MKKENQYPLPQQDYMVVVKCFTYNHEKFIEDALQGFVSQKTTFPFCALVVDDFSTDDTAKIIRRYEDMYPDIIKGVYLQENYYSQGGEKREKTEIITPWFDRSKYIAYCEGDDYWIDPYKLQKQVDFLESNPEYSMSFHKVHVTADNTVDTLLYKDLKEGEYFGSQIIENWIVPTCSVLVKKEVCLSCPIDSRFYMGDNVLFLTAARVGRVYCIPGIMGVYRRQSTGAVSGYRRNPLEYNRRMLLHYDALAEHIPQFDSSYKRLHRNTLLALLVQMYVIGDEELKQYVRLGVSRYGFLFYARWCKSVVGIYFRKILRIK